MKRLFFFLLLLSLLFSYSTSTYSYEKTWNITGEVGTQYTINGTFLVNDSEQLVESIELSEGEIIVKGSNLLFSSSGTLTSEEKLITATATVTTNYGPYLTEDDSLYSVSDPQNEIETQANAIVDPSSSAKTVIAFTKWMYENIEYNLLYSDIITPEAVFEERKGVCTAYASLLAYFLEYTDLEVIQVSGHSFSAFWQPHAWVEVKIGEEWITVDPTYNEVGLVSPDHIKTYKNHNLSIHDTIHSYGDLYSFSSDSTLSKLSSTNMENPVVYSYDITTDSIEVTISNPTGKYLFVPYSMILPTGWGESIDSILFIQPEYDEVMIHEIDPEESVEEGYSYSVPFILTVMGEEIEDEVVYSVTPDEDEIPNCPLSIIILLIPLFCSRR